MRRIAFALAFTATAALAPFVAAPLHAEEQPSADEAKIQAAAKVVQKSLDFWRARNFEGWLSMFSSDVTVALDGGALVNKAELRRVYKVVFDLNAPPPEIIDSGWTGERVFIIQREFGAGGEELAITYGEYEVRGGKITAVYGWVR